MELLRELLAAAGPLNYVAAIVFVLAVVGLFRVYRSNRRERVPVKPVDVLSPSSDKDVGAPEEGASDAAEAREQTKKENVAPNTEPAKPASSSPFKPYIPPSDDSPQ